MRSPSCLFLIVALGFAVSACKESMHPAPESEPTPEPAATQPDKPQPAATANNSAESAAKKELTNDGYEIVRAKTADGEKADLAVKAPAGWKVVEPPNTPDPHAGKFTLSEALKALPGKGQLSATITTSMGTLRCDLFEDKAPITVANFVGLARGLRKFWSGADHAWVGRPYYNGTTFHRVIPGFMIQGGDFAGDGSGGMFYTIPDELHPSLKHDRGGLLCMANRGPNTNEAQFFITEAAAPHLDGSYTIFGQCTPTELVYRIARVPQAENNKPITPVIIKSVTIQRGAATAGNPQDAKASTAPLPKNTVPGVAPPGRGVQVTEPARTEPRTP
jgi:peptidyl-prolyl cis-trans isomerase A (cyclophilin A)